MATYEVKTPDEVKDFELDWSCHLGRDAIETSTWSAKPDDLGISTIAATFTAATATVWLSGGECGTAYAITNTITTRGGRTLQDCFYCDVC